MLSDSLATPLAAAPEASASHHPTYRYAPNATHLVCVAGLHSFLVLCHVTLQAGAAYAVGTHAGGFVVQASGYSQRLPDLSVALAEAIAKFDPDPERFEMHAELLRCMHPYEYGVCSLPRASISSLKLSGDQSTNGPATPSQEESPQSAAGASVMARSVCAVPSTHRPVRRGADSHRHTLCLFALLEPL